MKNNTSLKLLIILLIAFLLRIWHLDKPEGLWNDEYMGWYIASQNSFSDFIKLISNNCHTPLYYCFLRFWLMIFPDTDISLRFSSLVPSILTIITLFFVGKEYKNVKTGLICSLFAALSSFYIYFAQEVRLYSLIAFVTTLLVYVCIKLLKTGKKRFFVIFLALNALLCGVHTLGLIFSFFIILYSFIYLYKNFDNWKKVIMNVKKTLQYIFPFICVLLLLSPFIFSILSSKSLSQFWSGFSFSKIAFSFIDFFSPIQCNISNSPNTFRSYLFKSGQLDFAFIIFALFPSLIAFIMLLKAFLQKEKILNLLIYTCASFFVVILVLCSMGKMILLTKYISEIYPVLILAFACGVQSLKKESLQYIVLCLYFAITLIYLYISPNAAPKMGRAEGNKIPVVLIEQSKLEKNDFIILTYYDIDKFKRYFKNSNKYTILSINKHNFHIPIFNNEDYYEVIYKGKALYRDTFKEYPNKNIVSWADTNVIKKTGKGGKVGILFLKGVSFFSNEDINNITVDDKQYKKTSIVFLAFSVLRNSLLYAFKDDFTIDSINEAGDWVFIVYKKVK